VLQLKKVQIISEVVMQKILGLIVGLSLLFATCAVAEIFRCRTPDGELVMTDNKTEAPADCKPVDEPKGSGSFNVVPSTPVTAVESTTASPEQKTRSDAQDVPPWQDDANGLVERYHDALLRSHKEDLEVNRRDAMQHIERLKQQKHGMLNALSKSGLKDHDQKAISKTLNEIPH
jgi:hypothetical protein